MSSKELTWTGIRLERLPWLPLLVVLVFVVMAAFPNLIAPHPPNKYALEISLQPPAWYHGGNWSYPLGTDSFGRDLLSRIIYGARVSLIVAAVALLLGAGVGTIVGLAAAAFGGKVDAILMRITDGALALPIIFIALLLVAILGPDIKNVVLAIGLLIWGRYARMIRGEAMSVMTRDFVSLAKVSGCSTPQLLSWHVFPNVVNTLVVLVTLQIGWVIIIEASLSFLGAGVPPPTPVWGGMVAEGRAYIAIAWWVSVLPGLAIMFVVLAFNFIGDWLREALDPKQRQV